MAASLGKLQPARWRRAESAGETREVDGNWKQHAWNYMDRFHIAYIHKAPGGLADAVDLASYTTELHGQTALQWAYAKDPAHGFDPKLLPARFGRQRRVFALWWFIFPNITLNYYPWGLSGNIYQPVPGRPDRTLFHWHHYVADEARYLRRDETWLSEPTDAEDIDAISQVRRGTFSDFAPRGRFAPLEETGPHWFHRLVSTRVFPPVK